MESSDFISTSEMTTTNTAENEAIQEMSVVQARMNINGANFGDMEVQMDSYVEDCEFEEQNEKLNESYREKLYFRYE